MTTTAQSSLKKVTLLTCVFTFLLVFFGNFHIYFGIEKFSLPTLLSHPQAFAELIAEALGGSLFLPLIHIAISSFFKSQRNAASRCKILIGWCLVTIISKSLALYNYVYVTPLLNTLN